MNAVVIQFAGESVAKGRPRMSGGNGRPIAYTPAKTRKYEAALRYAAQQAMEGRDMLTGPVTLSVTAYLPIPQSWSKKKQEQARTGALRPTSRPDLDNYAKLVADSLNTIVFADDAQIVEAYLSKAYSERPCLMIRVEPWQPSVRTLFEAAVA